VFALSEQRLPFALNPKGQAVLSPLRFVACQTATVLVNVAVFHTCGIACCEWPIEEDE